MRYKSLAMVTAVLLSACDSHNSIVSTSGSDEPLRSVNPAAAQRNPTVHETGNGETSMLRSAYSECIKDSGGVTPVMQDCIETEFSYQEARLNATYQFVREQLSADRLADFERAQEVWISERDAKCGFDAAEDGQAQRLEANDCFLEITAKRAFEIEAMKK